MLTESYELGLPEPGDGGVGRAPPAATAAAAPLQAHRRAAAPFVMMAPAPAAATPATVAKPAQPGAPSPSNPAPLTISKGTGGMPARVSTPPPAWLASLPGPAAAPSHAPPGSTVISGLPGQLGGGAMATGMPAAWAATAPGASTARPPTYPSRLAPSPGSASGSSGVTATVQPPLSAALSASGGGLQPPPAVAVSMGILGQLLAAALPSTAPPRSPALGAPLETRPLPGSKRKADMAVGQPMAPMPAMPPAVGLPMLPHPAAAATEVVGQPISDASPASPGPLPLFHAIAAATAAAADMTGGSSSSEGNLPGGNAVKIEAQSMEAGSGGDIDAGAATAGSEAHGHKKSRLVWTQELHNRFINALSHLGLKNAVPKSILSMMNVEGLSRENVASHLQKYRLYLRRLGGLSDRDKADADALQRVHEQNVQQMAAQQVLQHSLAAMQAPPAGALAGMGSYGSYGAAGSAAAPGGEAAGLPAAGFPVPYAAQHAAPHIAHVQTAAPQPAPAASMGAPSVQVAAAMPAAGHMGAAPGNGLDPPARPTAASAGQPHGSPGAPYRGTAVLTLSSAAPVANSHPAAATAPQANVLPQQPPALSWQAFMALRHQQQQQQPSQPQPPQPQIPQQPGPWPLLQQYQGRASPRPSAPGARPVPVMQPAPQDAMHQKLAALLPAAAGAEATQQAWNNHQGIAIASLPAAVAAAPAAAADAVVAAAGADGCAAAVASPDGAVAPLATATACSLPNAASGGDSCERGTAPTLPLPAVTAAVPPPIVPS